MAMQNGDALDSPASPAGVEALAGPAPGLDVGDDSLGRRYRYKLLSKLAGLPFNLAVQGIVPRALGPEAYGSFNFLTTFFRQVVNFFDSGTSAGFYTKLCQRPTEAPMVAFYWRFAATASVMLILGVAIVFWGGWNGNLWPDQLPEYVWIASLYCLGLWFVAIAGGMMDAYGQTVRGEMGHLLRRGVLLVLLAGLAAFGLLNLGSLFAAQGACLVVVLAFWARALRRAGRPLFPPHTLSRDEMQGYGREFWRYSHPLILYALLGMIGGILERWLLQRFGGSIAQGFYGLAFQVGTVCFLFTSAMTPLLTRQFSRAAHAHDLTRLRQDFAAHIPRFYFIAAFFGIFLAVQAEAVVRLFGGRAYSGAVAPVGLMCLYPLHRTYGQLSGSVFLATGQTGLYRNLGTGMMVIGLIVTWFLLAPPRWGGLHLQAYGLGLKMVCVQFVGVNVQLWFNTRHLRLRFARFLAHQLVVVAVLAALACAAKALTRLVIPQLTPEFFISGLVYTAGALALLSVFPKLAALKRGDLILLLKRWS